MIRVKWVHWCIWLFRNHDTHYTKVLLNLTYSNCIQHFNKKKSFFFKEIACHTHWFPLRCHAFPSFCTVMDSQLFNGVYHKVLSHLGSKNGMEGKIQIVWESLLLGLLLHYINKRNRYKVILLLMIQEIGDDLWLRSKTYLVLSLPWVPIRPLLCH